MMGAQDLLDRRSHSANASAGASEIVFDSGVSGTITLTSDLPGITDDLTITGPGASVLAISGDNHIRDVQRQFRQDAYSCQA